MSVPYHTLDLDEKLSYKQDKADGNLIVEGDNLPALKSLLPQYTGKIKCIYIDPPYNTGKEGWVYNDNVNSPLIKEWIGKEIAQDDLTRHDKWLSMMTPRLKLLRELLSDDGVIYISIDENESYHLRILMNEIFGEENFITEITIQRSKNGLGSKEGYSTCLDYILCYKRRAETNAFTGLEPDEDYIKRYNKEDEYGLYKVDGLFRKKGAGQRRKDSPGCFYPLYKRDDGSIQLEYDANLREIYPKLPNGDDGRWIWSKEFAKDKIYRLVCGAEETVYVKDYYSEDRRIKPKNLFSDNKYLTEVATEEIKDIFGKKLFDTPKPTQLIKDIVSNATKGDAIILDAFAGSGTTAQAVLELNEEDGGNRKFILIQMPENSEKEPNKNITRDITRERVIKVIEKKLKNKDIGFEYKRVGQPIDAETILSGQLPTYKQLAKYVYYLATGQSPKDKDIDEKKYLAGKVDHTEVYLLYTPDMEELKKMAITFEWAKEISKGNDNKKIVYAPACFMDDEYLEQFNIKFVSIPYNLFEREK